MEISNELAVSALGVTAERDGWGQFDVAVGDFHTAESFPDSLAWQEHCGPISTSSGAIASASEFSSR